MNPGVRCVKTPKGLEEMTQRKHGLSQRHRRLLILVDGSRALNDLAVMVPDTELPKLYGDLLEAGFIAPLETAPTQPASNEPVKAAPPGDDQQRFQMARNFMINTTSTFVGISASALLEHLEQCTSFDDLRRYYMDWSQSIRLTGDGRKAADKLEKQLASLLS